MSIRYTIRAALMLSGVFVGSRLLAADGERDVAIEINRANQLLRNGDVDGAMKAYGEVQAGASERADLAYNLAVAKYRKGEVAAAEQLFKQTAAAENDALAAKARYNLGNCSYASAIKQAEADRSAAIKDLGKAIDNYRSALEIDPNDADSRANIELAAAMIDKLRQQEKKQQQDKQQQNNKQQDNKQQDQQKQDQNQQKDDKQNEQQQDKSKSSDKQQQKDSQQDQRKDQQQKAQQQKPENSPNDKAKSDQAKQDQQQKSGGDTKNQSSDKKESRSKEQKPQDSNPGQQDPKSQPQEQKNSSSDEHKQPENESKPSADKSSGKNAEKHSDQPQPQMQSATQKKPMNKDKDQQDVAPQSDQTKNEKGSAAPKGLLTAGDQKDGKQEPQGKEVVGKPEMAQDGVMTMQEAEKMLQAIRDQEMLRRLKRQAAERNQHIPVDRDW